MLKNDGSIQPMSHIVTPKHYVLYSIKIIRNYVFTYTFNLSPMF